MTTNQKEINIKKLINGYTIETTPNVYEKFESLSEYLPSGNDVYITYLPDEDPKRIINTAKNILESKKIDINDFGLLLHENWKIKRFLSNSITNDKGGNSTTNHAGFWTCLPCNIFQFSTFFRIKNFSYIFRYVKT